MINLQKKMVATIAASLILAGTATSVLAEETEKPSADLSVDMLSKYVWRGYELSKDSIVIQPSMTVSYKGFGFNLWGNLDTKQDVYLYGVDDANWNETDMTLSYDNSFGMVNYSLGYIYYALDSADDTQEIYASIGLDTLLSPTLTLYRDFATYPGWYATLAVSHSFPITETIALEAGGHVSYLSADDENTLADPDDPTSAYSDFHDGQIYLALSIPVTDYLSITPELYYSFPLSSAASDIIEAGSASGNDDSFIYGGISLSMSF